MSDNEMKNAILDDAKLDAVSGGGSRGEGDIVWRCNKCMEWGYVERKELIPTVCPKCSKSGSIVELKGNRG